MALPPEQPTLRQIELWAGELGFDGVGVAPVALPHLADSLHEWSARGYAGDMAWLERNHEVRLDLRARFPWARSALILRFPYAGVRQSRGLSRHVSIYAQAQDYHELLLPRMQQLAAKFHGDARWHAYVDTGPVLERQLAAAAGLGWLGKNTLLLNSRTGSLAFLGVIVSELEFAPSTNDPGGSCGSCSACQTACPTDAFVAPGILDARRCISYLTIEHRGPIPRALRRAMGEWLFGCDLCQTACPFNHRPAEAPDELRPSGLAELDLPELLAMDDQSFRRAFRKTPLWRPRRVGLLRNALIVAANAERFDCVEAILPLLRDESEILREGASHALTQLLRAPAGVGESDRPAVETALGEALAREAVDWVAAAMREDLQARRR